MEHLDGNPIMFAVRSTVRGLLVYSVLDFNENFKLHHAISFKLPKRRFITLKLVKNAAQHGEETTETSQCYSSVLRNRQRYNSNDLSSF